MNNLERDSKTYDVLVMEMSTQEKTVRDSDWCGGKDTSHIQNKRTNEKIWLRQENGVYVWDLMVAHHKGTMIEVLIRIFTGRDSVYDTCKPD